MPAAVTMQEIAQLIQAYVVVEAKHLDANPTVDCIDGVLEIQKEYDRCVSQAKPASLLLRQYAKILSHYHDEAKQKKCPTHQALQRAITNLHHGMDIPKAIKRARILN